MLFREAQGLGRSRPEKGEERVRRRDGWILPEEFIPFHFENNEGEFEQKQGVIWPTFLKDDSVDLFLET